MRTKQRKTARKRQGMYAMTHTELNNIIKEIGFNKADMARVLGIRKTTFQRYTDSSAQISDGLAARIMAEREKQLDFMARLPDFLKTLPMEVRRSG